MKGDYLGESRMKPEVDEARLLVAAIAMHGFVSSPLAYSHEQIVTESVQLADKLISRLGESNAAQNRGS